MNLHDGIRGKDDELARLRVQLSAALAKVTELEQENARLRREVEDLRDEALAGRSR